MAKPRYLTKSRYKLACECPTKLYYTGKPEYADQTIQDSFLEALAEGGMQIGELAKFYIPGGTLIETLDYDEAEKQTLNLLKQEMVVIYEAAVRFNNLFIRADIVVKDGKNIQLIEVKAKSFDGEDDTFLTKKGTVSSKWEPYLQDIAFQTLVFRSAYPEFKIESFLFLVDQSSECPTDGLNQKFLLERGSDGRAKVRVRSPLSPTDLSQSIMTLQPVSDIINSFLSNPEFEKNVALLADKYERDERIDVPLGSQCGGCQYFAIKDDLLDGKKSGRTECWQRHLGVPVEDLERPTVLNLWDFRSKDHAFSQKKYFLTDLTEDDLNMKEDGKAGLSRTARQLLQITKVRDGDNTPYIDKDGLEAEFRKWRYPLHFIDFETTTTPIPFHKGRRPYEGIAFQFSHHTVQEDGSIKHAGQFLHNAPGEFPNFAFIRALKRELESDGGTIFRYAAHENTFLNFILEQLEASNEPDRDGLSDFIRSITRPTGKREGEWEPDREMVDMLQLVKRYYYHPLMGGSNSIKVVLPSVLASSKELQERFSQPIYGTEAIPSFNFTNHAWVEFADDGAVLDPYKRLPRLFKDTNEETARLLYHDEKLADGGAAMIAWARMQFTEMSQQERDELSAALLKYCELDTFAMVLIYCSWKSIVDLSERSEHLLRICRPASVTIWLFMVFRCQLYHYVIISL